MNMKIGAFERVNEPITEKKVIDLTYIDRYEFIMDGRMADIFDVLSTIKQQLNLHHDDKVTITIETMKYWREWEKELK